MSAADHDVDSQMTSPSDSESPVTPPTTTGPNPTSHPASSTLSPPDSQHRAMANANGKRPLNTISNGPDGENDDLEIIAPQQPGAATIKPRQEFPVKIHQASGYKWSRADEEPGYAWMNKKALDELHRAWDGLLHKDSMVKGRYGDPFEAADREKAMINSMKQQ